MNLKELKYFLEVPEKLLSMDKEELKHIFGSDFATMQGYLQNNPHHCYDLLEHTIKTVEAIDCAELSKDEIIELKIAALYHDVGKPSVAFEKSGKTVFYNHAIESRRISEKEFKDSGLDDNVINRILFFIEYHDAFISFKCPNEIKDKNNKFIIPIQKETVKSKVISIKKDCAVKGSYVPKHKDFLLLLKLCLADVETQSEVVMQNGIQLDSKRNKQRRLHSILAIIQNHTMNFK